MRLRRIAVLLALFLGFQNIRAYGQVVATWIDSSGNWSNAANWSTNPTVPNNGGGTTYIVTISAPGSVVTMDVVNVTIDSLTLGAANGLNVTGGDSLILLGAGSSTNNGTISTVGPALLRNNSGSSLINNGAIDLIFFSVFDNGGTFVNNSKISAFGDSAIFNDAGAFLTNNGTFSQESGHLANVGTFNNTGVITLFSGSDPVNFTNSGTFNNSGTINVPSYFSLRTIFRTTVHSITLAR
jgi:hypothetical protein